MVELEHSRILLQVRPGTDDEKKQAVMEEWYREQIGKAVPIDRQVTMSAITAVG
jgi:hypothetical protein